MVGSQDAAAATAAAAAAEVAALAAASAARRPAAPLAGSQGVDATSSSPGPRELTGSGVPPGLKTHRDRVRSRLSAWRDIGASRQTLRWLGEGVRVPWNERGPPLPFHHGVGSFSPDERAWLTQERDRCLGTGAWRRATRCDYVSRAFVVWHKGKPRLVIDLRWVNEHVEKRSCRFESLATLRRLARRHDFMFSLDLTDAYHHIGVHESDVDYFTFAVETEAGVEYFSTPALNFGWTLSPWVFTQVLRDVVRYLRNPDAAARPRYGQRRRHSGVHRGVRTLPWLDDFAFFVRGVRADHPEYGAMLEAARAESMRVRALFGRLGLAVSPTKGQHEPSQRLDDHLGHAVDSTRGLFLLTPRRETQLAAEARSLICLATRERRLVPPRRLAAFAGLAQSSYLAVPLGRFMLRALHDDLATRRGWRSRDGVRLGRQSLADLGWWAELRGSKHVGRAIWRPAETRLLHTDASDLGWGAAVDLAQRHAPAHGFWSPGELPFHITWKELVAVRKGVEFFLPQLAGRRVLLREDNMAVVWILTSMVSRSPQLMHELRKLWYVLDAHDIDLRALYIRSAANVIADRASRLAVSGDYALTRTRFEALQAAWGECTVDAFASPATALLPRYWAAGAIAGAEAVDAFSQEWRGEQVWAHPPPGLLLQLVQLLEETGASAHVCAPHWPSAAWYPLLLELSSEHVVLPPGSLERVAADAPPRLASWPVAVFRVSGATR